MSICQFCHLLRPLKGNSSRYKVVFSELDHFLLAGIDCFHMFLPFSNFSSFILGPFQC